MNDLCNHNFMLIYMLLSLLYCTGAASKSRVLTEFLSNLYLGIYLNCIIFF